MDHEVKVRHGDVQEGDVHPDGAAGDLAQPVAVASNVQMLDQQLVKSRQEALEELGVVQDQVTVAGQRQQIAHVFAAGLLDLRGGGRG